MALTQAKKEAIAKKIKAAGFLPILRTDGRLVVSAENGDQAADYYGEFRGGYPWINPKLEEIVDKAGCMLEWESPGALSVWEK